MCVHGPGVRGHVWGTDIDRPHWKETRSQTVEDFEKLQLLDFIETLGRGREPVRFRDWSDRTVDGLDGCWMNLKERR